MLAAGRGSRSPASSPAARAPACAAPAPAQPPASYEGASADGDVVFFTTDDQLVPGDTDSRRDVFERSNDARPATNT